MHELSLCRAMVRIVERASDGRRVERVGLQVGVLRQVIPATLEYAWGFVTADTPMAGSVLDIEQVPLAIACGDCGERTALVELNMQCGRCESRNVTVVSGEEFLLTTLDLAEE